MENYKELVKELNYHSQNLYDEEDKVLISIISKAANAIEQLCADVARLEAENRAKEQYIAETIVKVIKERDAAIADLEKCMHYAKPKNNNICNFCKKDVSERQNKCVGWSDFCECEPEWRGLQRVEHEDY